MSQSRLMSLVETVTNVVVGYGLAVGMQVLLFPLFVLQVTQRQNLAIRGVSPSDSWSRAGRCDGCSIAACRS